MSRRTEETEGIAMEFQKVSDKLAKVVADLGKTADESRETLKSLRRRPLRRLVNERTEELRNRVIGYSARNR